MSEEQLVENATIQLFDPCQYSTTLPKEAKDRYISKLVDMTLVVIVSPCFWSFPPSTLKNFVIK
ncbi:Uncharacterized protein APZ42_033179 [Daphnia magna]|uniref:Uncharacterized protein n=1 Tax=Daphnia magna TaxID=35525 RepID=A0A164LC55_9CRUS|nr:Uncharacterized protein APZ42_033179 [Daphnia magna]